MNDRMCIVTRASGDADDLIRFVADPDGVIVPDLRRILPGRGCWVTPERSILQQAIKRGSFTRALKKPVQASSELPDLVDKLLASDLLGMMGLARKAGQFVGGATKVDKSVRSGAALAVFHTTDAAEDGVRKIDQARKSVEMAFDLQVPSYRLFGIDAMEAALGEGALIHAAALAGQAGEGVVKRAKILHRYRTGPVGTRSGPDEKG